MQITAGNIARTEATLDGTPSSIVITITDPDGTVVINGVAMTLDSGYTYYHKYQTTSASTTGTYTVLIEATVSGDDSIAYTYFEVIEAEVSLLPTPADVRALLEGYCITSSTITDAWIESRRDRFVVPWIERKTRFSITGDTTVIEYHSGDGSNIMYLDRRGATALTSIEYVVGGDYTTELEVTDFILLGKQGLIKAVRSEYIVGLKSPAFPKGNRNIKITYTVGYDYDSIPAEIQEAILYFTTEKVLSFIANRGGGGDISVNSYSKSYGNRGKFTDIRNELTRMGYALINQYKTSTVGS